MTAHVAVDLLESFAAGELGDHAAALVARHLDECPACTARVLAADPLTAALRVPEPALPPDLVARVLEAAAPPAPGLARAEVVTALALLAAGALAYTLSVDLASVGGRLDVLSSALTTAGAQLRAQPALVASLAATSAAAAVTALTLATRLSGRVR